MFLLVANSLSALRPDLGPFSKAACGIAATDSDLQNLRSLSKLRFGRYSSLHTAAGEIALRQLMPSSIGRRKACITACLQSNMEISRIFLDRIHSAGPRMVNPIMFPHTLPSACAVTLGAIYGAHVGSFSIEGSDAFTRSLIVSCSMLDSCIADEIFFFSSRLSSETKSENPTSFALGFLISRDPISTPCLELTEQPKALPSDVAGSLGDEYLAMDIACLLDDPGSRGRELQVQYAGCPLFSVRGHGRLAL